MESIDRLRDWLKGRLLLGNGWNELNEIADAIEREAKANRVDAYTKGYDEGFASADDWAAQHEDAMAEHGWVKLPVSDDGDVLHIGELVDERLPFGGYAAPAPIDTMELSRGASGYSWMVKLDAANRALISPKLLRHHHNQTVEDVLREMMQNAMCQLHDDGSCEMGLTDEQLAKYAQMLQLKEDE